MAAAEDYRRASIVMVRPDGSGGMRSGARGVVSRLFEVYVVGVRYVVSASY